MCGPRGSTSLGEGIAAVTADLLFPIAHVAKVQECKGANGLLTKRAKCWFVNLDVKPLRLTKHAYMSQWQGAHLASQEVLWLWASKNHRNARNVVVRRRERSETKQNDEDAVDGLVDKLAKVSCTLATHRRRYEL